MKPHRSTRTFWRVGASDVSAHRILSDFSAFIGHEDSSRHRILAAGDLNMIYGATGGDLSLPTREKTVWDRMSALGLEFLGPQAPDGWQPSGSQPDVPPDTRNVPTWVQKARRHLAGQKTLSVLGEYRRVPHPLFDPETHEPAEQKVELQLLHQLAFRADRVESLQKKRPQQLLRRDPGTPVRAYRASKSPDISANVAFVSARIARSGWPCGTRASKST